MFVISLILQVLGVYTLYSNFSEEYHSIEKLKRKIDIELIQQLKKLKQSIHSQNKIIDSTDLKTYDDILVGIREKELKEAFENEELSGNYDIENRMILQQIYFDDQIIENYIIINMKNLPKIETGSSSNILTIYSNGKNLKIYDQFGYIMLEKQFDFIIDKIYSFENDGNSIYLLSDQNKVLRKFNLELKFMSEKKQDNELSKALGSNLLFQKINLEVFESKKKSHYQIVSDYYVNLKRRELTLNFESKYDNNDIIEKITLNSHQNDKFILIETNNTLKKLNEKLNPIKSFNLQKIYESLDILDKNISKYYVFLNFIGFYYENIISINLIEDLKSVLFCSFDQKIIGFIFDSTYNYIFILFENSRLQIFGIRPSPDNKDYNYCHLIDSFEIKNIDNSAFYHLELFQRDLFIDIGDKFICLDVSNIEKINKNNIRYVDKNFDQSLPFYYKNSFNGNLTNKNMQTLKNSFENRLIYRSHNNQLILINLLNSTHKPPSNDPYLRTVFPVLVISIFAVFIYKYFKKEDDVIRATPKLKNKNKNNNETPKSDVSIDKQKKFKED